MALLRATDLVQNDAINHDIVVCACGFASSFCSHHHTHRSLFVTLSAIEQSVSLNQTHIYFPLRHLQNNLKINIIKIELYSKKKITSICDKIWTISSLRHHECRPIHMFKLPQFMCEQQKRGDEQFRTWQTHSLSLYERHKKKMFIVVMFAWESLRFDCPPAGWLEKKTSTRQLESSSKQIHPEKLVRDFSKSAGLARAQIAENQVCSTTKLQSFRCVWYYGVHRLLSGSRLNTVYLTQVLVPEPTEKCFFFLLKIVSILIKYTSCVFLKRFTFVRVRTHTHTATH